MKEKVVKVILMVILLISFVGCKDKEGKEGEKKGEVKADKTKTFILGISGNPKEIDPVTSSGRYGLMSVKQIFNPLFVLNGVGDYTYYLAEDFSSNDSGTVYTAKLRKDVKWQDGEDFTADDVVFSFNVNESDTKGQYYDVLQLGGNPLKVEKVDDYTVTFTSTKPSGIIPELISNIFIIPKHVYKDAVSYNAKVVNPVGSGAYKLESYNEGNSIVFSKNKDYFLGNPDIDKVIFKIFTDENSASLALQNGDINALVIQPADIPKYSGKGVTTYPYSENRVGYLSFNLNSVSGNEVQNKEFRRGVLKGINKSDLIKASYMSKEYATTLHSFLPPKTSYNNQDVVEGFDYNPSEAKKIVDGSGVKSKTLKLAYINNDNTYKKMALLIQENLSQIGVSLELVPVDGTAMFNQLIDKNGNFDMYLGGYIMGIDPENYGTLFITGGQGNYSGYSNEKVDELFKKGVNEVDSKKRQEIYEELQKTLIGDAFFYPIADNKRILAVTDNIGGVEKAKLVSIYGFEDMGQLYLK